MTCQWSVECERSESSEASFLMLCHPQGLQIALGDRRGDGWAEGVRKGTQPVAYSLELGARVLEGNIELPASQETWGKWGR